jgi:sugar phosphate isomerase/epimerase
MRFGISTHLFHDQRLTRADLDEIASAGFDAIELFATRTHFDYHDEAAIAELAGWLAATGLALHSVHAPITESFANNRWGPAFHNAATDPAARQIAVREAEAALRLGDLGARFLVLHLGLPQGQPGPANSRDAARRTLEDLEPTAASRGMRLAVEVIPNELSSAESLVRLIEDELELPSIGICLDFGHAFIGGDLVDAVETASGHIVTTHVHDNGGTEDDHLAPFDGAIDWPAALTAVRKIGYEDALVFEVRNTSTPGEVLARLRRVRQRFEEILGAGADPMEAALLARDEDRFTL